MTGLEQRLAKVIDDAKAGHHDSTEETVEFILQALADPGGRYDYENIGQRRYMPATAHGRGTHPPA